MAYVSTRLVSDPKEPEAAPRRAARLLSALGGGRSISTYIILNVIGRRRSRSVLVPVPACRSRSRGKFNARRAAPRGRARALKQVEIHIHRAPTCDGRTGAPCGTHIARLLPSAVRRPPSSHAEKWIASALCASATLRLTYGAAMCTRRICAFAHRPSTTFHTYV